MRITDTLTSPQKPGLDKLVKDRKGFILDIGSGIGKQPGAIGMDKQALSDVDVVHDWNDFPWPFEDESALTIIASHVVEHVNPADGHFIDWMNECWRILKMGRQMVIVTPYAGNSFYWQDPTHCNGCNERTWLYFDPDHPFGFYNFYQPAPWSVEQNAFHEHGIMEIILRKIPDKAEYHDDKKVRWGT